MQGKWFAQVAPGLEPALETELRALGLNPTVEKGGATFSGDQADMYRVLLRSRVTARLRRRIGKFKASSPEELAGRIRRLTWTQWVAPRQPLEVHVASSQSKLRHKDSVAKKTELAIQDALRGPRKPGRRPSRDPVGVHLRVYRDQVQVSVDATGELLHRRGWRLATGRAPIRENIGAAVLMMSGWAPGMALVDPMCGSGTFSIEAAGQAMGLAPGANRSFAFEAWPCHDERQWKAARQRLIKPAGAKATSFLAADRNGEAVRGATANAKRAGVSSQVAFRHTAFDDLDVPRGRPGLVIFNPPWGGRIASGHAVGAWRGIGSVLRRSWSGWRVALIGPHSALRDVTGLSLQTVASFESGGVRVSVWAGRLP